MALNLNYKPNKLVDITTLTEDQWLVGGEKELAAAM